MHLLREIEDAHDEGRYDVAAGDGVAREAAGEGGKAETNTTHNNQKERAPGDRPELGRWSPS